MKAPLRLREDGAVGSALRADLERSAATPYRYDAAAGLAALQLALGAGGVAVVGGTAAQAAAAHGAGAAASGAPAKAAALLASTGAKIGLATAGAAVVVASALVAPERPVWAPAPDAASPRSAAPARLAAPPRAAPRATTEPTFARSPEPDLPRTLPARDRQARREIAQLGRIKARLSHDPAGAYALAQAGHRQFARGLLRHEREGLAVLALFAIERRADAERRAHTFLARYPHSPLRDRIQQHLRQAR